MFPHEFKLAAHHGRLFHRGDFKYVVLDLLKDGPCHGYEIIQIVKDRSHGFYAPSPGVVYPMLQLLEEMGCLTSAQEDGKKTYTITEYGRNFLTERGGAATDVRERMKRIWGAHSHGEMHDAFYALWDIWKILKRHSARLTPEKMKRVNDILAGARKEIEAEMKG